MWNLNQQARLGGLGLLGGLGSSSSTDNTESANTQKVIDATSDDGVAEMVGLGLPVKFIPAQEG